MTLDKKVRENLSGRYLTVYTDQFEEGIAYAAQIKIPQIQLRGFLNSDINVDFKELEKLSDDLKIISISTLENVINVESIYSLVNLEKIYLDKQSFRIDISKFPKIAHLGSEYWKGLINFSEAYSLQSLVLLKLPNVNLKELSALRNLQILHIYSSKIQTLDGIKELPLEKLALVRNSYLEDIQAIKYLTTLKELSIEKCKKVLDYNFLDSLKDRIKVDIIK
jgi:hypothetical protein